jgi:glycerophosphoryl diester phosphodiesterase
MEPRPWIVAHRGASREAPENTLDAFAAAVRAGADMIELDVRATGDGRLVVHHDACLNDRPLKAMTFRSIKRRAPRVPLLEEVLRLLAGRIRLDVELKEKGVETAVVDLCRHHLPAGTYILSSFLPQALKTCRRLDPDIPLGLITRRDGPKGLTLCVEQGWPWLMLEDALATRALLERCRRVGVAVLVWTVNDPRRMKALLGRKALGGIVTDLPALALAQRARQRARQRACRVRTMSPFKV